MQIKRLQEQLENIYQIHSTEDACTSVPPSVRLDTLHQWFSNFIPWSKKRYLMFPQPGLKLMKIADIFIGFCQYKLNIFLWFFLYYFM